MTQLLSHPHRSSGAGGFPSLLCNCLGFGCVCIMPDVNGVPSPPRVPRYSRLFHRVCPQILFPRRESENSLAANLNKGEPTPVLRLRAPSPKPSRHTGQPCCAPRQALVAGVSLQKGQEGGCTINPQFAPQPQGRWRETSENPAAAAPAAGDEGSSADVAGQGAARRNTEQQLRPAKISSTN